MEFKDDLLGFRVRNNLTQKEVGELLNISSKSISRYECGNVMPNKLHKIVFSNKMKEYEEKGGKKDV